MHGFKLASSHRTGCGRIGIFILLLALLSGTSRAAFRYFDPTDAEAIPKTFSATGFYSDMARKTVVPEAVFFALNAALWSDGAWKQRWILLPPGKSIPYDDTTDFFAYPDSTVFVKNFWLETREGDTTSRILWETRLLMKWAGAAEENAWHGFSYRWNPAQDEAHLVAPTADFDTLIHYIDARGRRTYKRWRFPSTTCNTCHQSGFSLEGAPAKVAGRGVLGFYPAQLKRPSTATPGLDQVLELFSRGVFRGPAPDSASLGRRFIGIEEPMPPDLAMEDRGRFLDTKARSYLAANCSGCHGYRGIALGAIGDKQVNFDFYRLQPAIPFEHFPTQKFSLNDTLSFLPSQDPFGRAAFIEAVVMAGLDTGAGKPWNMALPAYAGDPRESLTPALLYPGYPSLTELLYRQVRRAAAWLDSAKLFRFYSVSAAGGNTDAVERLSWLFKEPWGSRAWEDTLANHGWSLDSVFATTSQIADGQYRWYRAPEQMPELATYLPDTAALNVLAAWVRQYSPSTGIRAARRPQTSGALRIVGRDLLVAGGRGGTLVLADIQGRKRDLVPVGPGRYRLPDSLRPGVYFIQFGTVSFRFVEL